MSKEILGAAVVRWVDLVFESEDPVGDLETDLAEHPLPAGIDSDAKAMINCFKVVASRHAAARWAERHLEIEQIYRYIKDSGPVAFSDVEQRFGLDRQKSIAAINALSYDGMLLAAEYPGPLVARADL